MKLNSCSRLFFAAAVLCGVLVGSAVNASSENGVPESPIKKCLNQSKNSRLAVQFMMDESSSLAKSDPTHQRVNAVKMAVSALMSNVIGMPNLGSSVDEGEDENDTKATSIDILFSGFAKEFDTHGNEWTELTPESRVALFSQADEFKKRNVTPFTDYQKALEGAEREFVKYDRERPNSNNCKVLIWFSDGNLDVDNRSGDQKPEEKVIGSICKNESGIVDRLRSQGVVLMGFGLSGESGTKAPNFDLMSRIVEGGCGERVSNGIFSEVTSAERLIQEMFRNLFPSEPDPSVPCIDQPNSDNCREVVFKVRAPLDRINALVSITPSIEKAVVIAPDKSEVEFGTNGQVKLLNESFVKSTPSFDLATVLSLSVANRDGEWRIRFIGPGAKYAAVFSIFFSDLVVDVEGMPLSRDKNKSEPIFVSIGKTDTVGLDSSSGVSDFDDAPAINAEIVFSGTTKNLITTETVVGSGRFSIDLPTQELLKLPGLVSLRLTPSAKISGHKIEFSSTTVGLSLRLGDGFPSIKNVSVTNIDGRGSSKVTIQLSGPEEGLGKVSILNNSLSVDELPAGHKDGSAKIKTDDNSVQSLAPKTTGEVTALISPTFAANGRFVGSIKVRLENNRKEIQEVNVPFDFNMTKPFDVAALLWIALLMIAVFVSLQVLIFLFVSDLLSRIGKVPEGTWYALFRVRVLEDGSVDVVSPTNWEAVATESSVPVDSKAVSKKRSASFGSFQIRGFRRDGLKSLLSAEDSFVSGSSGNSAVIGQTSRDSDNLTMGRISQSLAGQWLAAVSQETVKQLASASDGSTSLVEPEDPYAREFGGGFDSTDVPTQASFEAEILFFLKDFNPTYVEDIGRGVREALEYGHLRETFVQKGLPLLEGVTTEPIEPKLKNGRKAKKSKGATSPIADPPSRPSDDSSSYW